MFTARTGNQKHTEGIGEFIPVPVDMPTLVATVTRLTLEVLAQQSVSQAVALAGIATVTPSLRHVSATVRRWDPRCGGGHNRRL